MIYINDLEKKWGTPFVKDGISKKDKAGQGQINSLNIYFNKYPVQIMELTRLVLGDDRMSILLPDHFNHLMRWEANWILGRIVPYFSNTKRAKKVRRLGKNKLFSESSIASRPAKPHKSSKLNYYEYIISPEWQERSKQAKAKAGNRCQICNRSSRQVVLHTHHRTYERLGNEADSDLTVLCADCHKLYEDNKKLKKHP